MNPEPQVKLEDILPLAFTRLCEPKEASYSLIRKYVSQYYPKLRVDIRPQLLKNALQRAVERGQLEQITGKGASGTFQLKKSGEKPLLGGSLMEYAILSAIAAMNEPKTCSTTALKKYVLENHPGTNSNYQMHLLKKTLQRCERTGGWNKSLVKDSVAPFSSVFPIIPVQEFCSQRKSQMILKTRMKRKMTPQRKTLRMKSHHLRGGCRRKPRPRHQGRLRL